MQTATRTKQDAKDIEKELDKVTGKKLRQLREKAGLTQKDVGRKIGVSYQQIQKYEKATVRMTLAAATQLSAAVNATIGDLLPESIALLYEGASAELLNLTTAYELLDPNDKEIVLKIADRLSRKKG